MTNKKLLLSIPTPIYQKLENEKKIFAYASIQELINEILRDKYFRAPSKKEKRGRPKKVDVTNVLSRKKIFDKHGVAIDV